MNWRVGSGLALAVLTMACSERPTEVRPPRLVVLYATCTVGSATLSPYTDAIEHTPHLAALAAESVVFERHMTESGLSGIAYASIFSGLQSDGHSIYRHPERLGEDLYLISEAFRDRGYRTYAFSGHPNASLFLGYAQGVKARDGYRGQLDPDSRALAKILDPLGEDPETRAFVQVNFTMTHAPYALTDFFEFRRTFQPDLDDIGDDEIRDLHAMYRREYLHLTYNFDDTVARLGLTEQDVARLRIVLPAIHASTVHQLDAHLGRLLAVLRARDLLDDTLFVFTADHGEVMGRDNAAYPFGHGMQLAPEVLHVPLIVRSGRPDISPVRYAEVTRSIDVFPTVMGLSGMPLGSDHAVAGIDLTPALTGAAPPPTLKAYSHTSALVHEAHRQMQAPETAGLWSALQRDFPDPGVRHIWAQIREGDTVYMRHRSDGDELRYSVYDLARDPELRIDRFDPNDAKHLAMRDEVDAYRQRLIDHYPVDDDAQRIPPEQQREALRALGYIQ